MWEWWEPKYKARKGVFPLPHYTSLLTVYESPLALIVYESPLIRSSAYTSVRFTLDMKLASEIGRVNES